MIQNLRGPGVEVRVLAPHLAVVAVLLPLKADGFVFDDAGVQALVVAAFPESVRDDGGGLVVGIRAKYVAQGDGGPLIVDEGTDQGRNHIGRALGVHACGCARGVRVEVGRNAQTFRGIAFVILIIYWDPGPIPPKRANFYNFFFQTAFFASDLVLWHTRSRAFVEVGTHHVRPAIHPRARFRAFTRCEHGGFRVIDLFRRNPLRTIAA